ncbi:hypothetical protein Tco_0345096 [Tanacetum coccineum]
MLTQSWIVPSSSQRVVSDNARNSLHSESPLSTHRLHEAPSSIGNFVTHEPAYNCTAIHSDPVVTTQDSGINLAILIVQTNTFCTQLAPTSASEIDESSKQKEPCPHGSDKFLVNKGDARFAAQNIQAPSVTAPNPAHTHVVTLTQMSIATKGTQVGIKKMRSRTCVRQAQADCCHQRLSMNHESPTNRMKILEKFKRVQEVCQKRYERAFGVLHIHLHLTPVRKTPPSVHTNESELTIHQGMRNRSHTPYSHRHQRLTFDAHSERTSNSTNNVNG